LLFVKVKKSITQTAGCTYLLFIIMKIAQVTENLLKPQASNPKLQTNAKFQTPNFKQITMTKTQKPNGLFGVFGNWDLVLV
jgi:hypothetical protein